MNEAGNQPAALTLQEAVPLGYALVARVARDAGVRALSIKGPVSVAQGLRPPGRSADVDLWVDPARRQVLFERLSELGWRPRVVPTSAHVLPLHAQSLAHVNWPCEIDLHDRYPGFLAPPQVVFEHIWGTHTTVSVAGTDVDCPSVAASAAIQTLQVVRDRGRETDVSGDDRITGAARALSEADRRQLVELAQETGASETLRDLFEQLPVSAGSEELYVDELRAWQIAVASPGTKSLPALFELSNAPLRAWPRLIWRSLLLTEDEIRERQPQAAPTRLGLFGARLRRWWWGLRGLPHAVYILVRHRRHGP